MPNIREIRRRIRSVQNTAKITSAMEMIAASKMRRAQQRVLAGRPYEAKMRQVLGNLAAQVRGLDGVDPLLQRRETKHIMLIHITPDRGLTGGLNSNLNRRAAQFVLEEKLPVSSIAIGKKGRDFLTRHGQNVKAVFTDMGDQVTVAQLTPIIHLMRTDYLSGAVDRVYLSYADFVSTTVQRPTVKQLLPIETVANEAGGPKAGYIYEPNAADVLAHLLPRFIEMELYQAMLESNASEQSARMVAMRNATSNAKDMVSELTLDLNKARQAAITNELLDITGGVVALGG